MTQSPTETQPTAEKKEKERSGTPWWALALGVFLLFIILIFIYRLTNKPQTPTTKTSNGSKTSSESKTSVCQAKVLKTKDDGRVQAEISAVDNPQALPAKESYSLDELKKLSYGFKADEGEKAYYAEAQLCKGDEAVSKVKLKADNYLKVGPKTSGVAASKQNHYNFVSHGSDGTEYALIKEPGEYTLYIYASDNGNDWYVAKKYDFQVK